MPAVHRHVPYVADPLLYRQHYGGAIPVFRGTIYQEGYGLGSLFGSVLRSVLPALKSTAISAGKTLLRSGAQAVGDVLSGERNVKEAIRKRGMSGLKTVRKNITARVLNSLDGPKSVRRTISKRRHSSKSGDDIFQHGITKRKGRKLRKISLG